MMACGAINIARLDELGEHGVLAAIGGTTNAMVEGSAKQAVARQGLIDELKTERPCCCDMLCQ